MTEPITLQHMHNAVWRFASEVPATQNQEVVQSYLLRAMGEHNIVANSLNAQGCNIGFYLAGLGNVHYLKAAENLGVDFSHRNFKGETALFHLFGAAPMLYLVESSTQPKECVDFLLKTCALTDVNTLDQTPLFGLWKMVEDNGMFSTVVLQDLRSMPSAEYPEYIRHYEKLLHYAVQCGTDISHKDHSGHYFVDQISENISIFDLNQFSMMFHEWRNQIDKMVLTKELLEVDVASSKRRL